MKAFASMARIWLGESIKSLLSIASEGISYKFIELIAHPIEHGINCANAYHVREIERNVEYKAGSVAKFWKVYICTAAMLQCCRSCFLSVVMDIRGSIAHTSRLNC